MAGVFGLTASADEPKTNGWPDVSITPSVQYISVKGDQDQFRANQWVHDGWTYGVDSATLQQSLSKDTTLDFTGRAISDGDYKLTLDVTKKDVGFVRAGFSQYRKYSDTTGGYFQPFSVPSFTLPGDFALNVGKIYADIGLTLPNLPVFILGYERDYRTGQQSLLEWGSVTEGTTTRKIYPSYQNVDEHVDIIKFGVTHDIKSVHVDNQFRYEYYKTDTTKKDGSVDLNTATSKTTTIKEEYNHDAFYNTFRMDSHLNNKVYWSLGYLFTTLDGNAGVAVSTPPPLVATSKNWATQVVNNNLSSHLLSFNMLFGPFSGFNIYAGVQAEFTDTDGYTDALLTQGIAATTTNKIHSSNNKQSFEETLGVRYNKIAFTTLYAEARWTEQSIDLNERETENAAPDFQRQTDTGVVRQDYRVGFNTAPVRRLTLSGQYRYAFYHNDYNNNVDTELGYPAFINLQDFETDEVMGKVTWRACSKLTAAFTYRYVDTDITTGTDAVPAITPGGQVTSGRYNANIYSVSATLTPISRLYLTGLLSLQDTCTTSYNNNSPAVAAYRGNVYTVISTLGYALDKKTDATLEYSYSSASDITGKDANGLPLGADYRATGIIAGLARKINDHTLVRVRYGWYQYDDAASGGANNYTAQLVSANCTLRF
ncbi:MAG: hypothetical protein WCS70_05630 [Verrucomicrobiota bacterium]